MGSLDPAKLLMLGILAVIIFGPTRLPEIGRTIGKGLREFRESIGGVTDFTEAVSTVGEVRSAMSPTNLAGALIPGVRDVQETVAAAKGSATGEAAASTTAEAGEAAAGEPAAVPPA